MVNMTSIVLEEPAPYLDNDGLWKKVITDLFEPFVLFFSPDLYEKLDWSKKPDSLEQEFHRAIPKKKGTKYTDKLMKVHLKNGKEQWLLVHVEVQGYKDEDFPERMFQYFYRIFDKYDRKIYAIALLADPDHSFKPTIYKYHFHGTDLTYSYNTYKLLEQDEEELLQSDNPFAHAVLAGIYMLKTRNNASKRYQFKRRLLEFLLQDPRKNSQEYIQSLFHFIDYLLEVPEEMTRELQKDIEPMIEKEASYMDKTMYPDPPTLKPFIDKWRKEGKKEIAVAMLKKGFSSKEIIELTSLTEKELDEIKGQM
ncbi:hypothetical protein MUB24_16305 [Lederbergia sp. NSJ-179]|uniref:hypothetical protein n=1 Tax=Lederbergia sp. NSJ-179 TaxID=2931402 RepID=UPI001FD28C1C|nr:hypothetical protein [Lederbergia sp. NSJ-179]MCJ7842431.1 hypothetical protein [Lederbergia sp. NSJ-179]